MIRLNTITNSKYTPSLNNVSSINFHSRAKINGDEFIPRKKQNVIVADELKTIFKNEKAIKLIKNEVDYLQTCKQRVTQLENGWKTITFHKGLRIFPNSYKGEINYNKEGNIYSVVIPGNKIENYNGIPCRKYIIINKPQGLQITYEKNNTNQAVAEARFNLYGKIQEKTITADNKKITLSYNNGKIITKDITFIKPSSKTPIDHIQHRYSGPVREIIDYSPSKYGVRKREAYDENFNLVYKKISGIRKGNAIISITKGYKKDKDYKIQEIFENDKYTYIIEKGNFKIKFNTPINILCTDSERIPVELYRNEEFRGIRNINAKKIVKHLSL